MTSEKMVGLDKKVSAYTRTAEEEPVRIGDADGMFLVNDEGKPTYILALAGGGPLSHYILALPHFFLS